jgi:uncharacterized protein (DUF1810 family)
MIDGMDEARPDMAHDLERFLVAQQHPYNVYFEQGSVFEGAVEELRRGRKTCHWMWFIFPQIDGLGSSTMAQRFAIGSLDEARAYLAHPVLGQRLRQCVAIVLETTGRTAEEIFGWPDVMKLRSCMTLFHRAAPAEPVFKQVLDRYYGGVADELTDARIG